MALLILPNEYPVQNFEPSVSVVAYVLVVFCFYIILVTLEVYYNNIIRMKDEEINSLKHSIEKSHD